MSKSYETEIDAQPSIYTETHEKKRKLKIRFSLPEEPCNEETGVLILIPAYGGGFDSNVYKKMHRLFPDEHNMIVVQCNSFGTEFMQTYKNECIEFCETDEYKNGGRVFYSRVPGETLEYCHDMGIMQAVDVIRAALCVISAVSQSGHKINFGKIITYGSSHGSYLGYMINRLCPDFVSLIVDNSSYCIPTYLSEDREMHYTNKEKGDMVEGFYEYLIKREREKFLPNEFYDLNELYRNFNNTCKILSFHGSLDTMVPIWEKRKFIDKVNCASLIEITPGDVDDKYFKSCDHGLGVDLLELYEAVDMLSKNTFSYKESLDISPIIILEGNKDRIIINYDGLDPIINWEKF